jgi:hypothetical protein
MTAGLFSQWPHVTQKVDQLEGNEYDPSKEGRDSAPIGESNVTTSMLVDGGHTLVLDIDVPAVLVPSSTPGHSHLFIDVAMGWPAYSKLLDVLAEVGVVQPGYVSASVARGYTSVRLPWVRKDPAPAVTEEAAF